MPKRKRQETVYRFLRGTDRRGERYEAGETSTLSNWPATTVADLLRRGVIVQVSEPAEEPAPEPEPDREEVNEWADLTTAKTDASIETGTI